DPNWSKQANLREISMPSAWEETKGSKDVKVAVIDSGIDYQHEDLSGNVDESLGYDFFYFFQENNNSEYSDYIYATLVTLGETSIALLKFLLSLKRVFSIICFFSKISRSSIFGIWICIGILRIKVSRKSSLPSVVAKTKRTLEA
ncbi:TPA: S8 family serine peptidase, partial [Enterococcus faecium]|nr:S8 family serine peptidase [Enterococcus faecium]